LVTVHDPWSFFSSAFALGGSGSASSARPARAARAHSASSALVVFRMARLLGVARSYHRPRREGSAERHSPLAQEQVQHPAPPDMGAGTAQVREDGWVVAAGVLQRVGEDREANVVQVARG